MGLVERVRGESGHLVEQLVCRVRVDPVCHASLDPARLVPVDECLPFRLDLVQVLLAHGPPDQVGPAEAVARETLEDRHDLLLVRDGAIGGFQDRLQFRRQVFQRLAAVLDGNHVIKVL